MAYVRNFGKGYYGVETEGVTISPEVEKTIQKAFDVAKSIADENIMVHTATDDPAPEGESSSS
jgi:hypothetical protein